MLARLAACAVFVLIWPNGTALADEDAPWPLPEIIIEAAGPAQAAIAKRVEIATPPYRADVVTAPEGDGPFTTDRSRAAYRIDYRFSERARGRALRSSGRARCSG